MGGEVSPLHRKTPWKRCWDLMKDGDLWKCFAGSAKAKNPAAVTVTKVKGHAASDMVKEEKVRFDDKHGNDEADAAAENGATLVQPAVRLFATFYERRRKEYSKFMAQVQNFIVKVNKAEKDKREEEAMKENPFEDKDKDKIVVPRTLTYEHDTQEAMQIKIRRPRRQDYGQVNEWEQAARACNFITHSRWCKGREETEAGVPGTSWIELYILFKLHDGQTKNAKQLAKKETLQTELARFKKCMRKLAMECIDETQEWIFDTCYSRKNRLLQAAVSNKHAGIKGMPVLTQCEKELVMRILLEIKGKSIKKHDT